FITVFSQITVNNAPISYTLWQQQCREAVQRGKESGELRTNIDPEYLYFHLCVIFHGLVEFCLEEPELPQLTIYSERVIRKTITMLQNI
ncbi:MAG: hypothetical protein Q4A74_06210, partial [Cardiobacteriaceae bacterium]|nr:hypothetical protein [Cardiobacteriaceae bacterium]